MSKVIGQEHKQNNNVEINIKKSDSLKLNATLVEPYLAGNKMDSENTLYGNNKLLSYNTVLSQEIDKRRERNKHVDEINSNNINNVIIENMKTPQTISSAIIETLNSNIV